MQSTRKRASQDELRTFSYSLIVSKYRKPGIHKDALQSCFNREGMLRAVVITVSDSCFQGKRVDVSGKQVVEVLRAHHFDVVAHLIVPDERDEIEDVLRQQCEVAPLVVTTGGTGVAPRDVTPEATRAVCDRILDGFGELMREEGRKQTRFAPLSRSVTGTRGKSLVVNLPGSPAGAKTSLEAVVGLIPHTLTILQGIATQHDEHHGIA